VTTKRQVEANRRNAQRSTGPKTEKGKAVAKFNALRHGLTAKEVVISGEDEKAFMDLQDRFVKELDPKGVLESQLVERIAVGLWRLRRVCGVEAGIFALQRYRIEYDRAKEEIMKFQSHSLPDLSAIDKVITDQEEHDRAVRKAEQIRIHGQQELPTLGLAFVQDAANANALTKLSRYGAAIERSFYRALHELQRLQAARQGGTLVPVAVDLTIDSEESVAEG